MKPNEYFDQIKALGFQTSKGKFSLDLSAENVIEAKNNIAKLQLIQRNLQYIKRNINNDMKLIRETYKERIERAGSGISITLRIFGKRGAARSTKAKFRKVERAECDKKLAQYKGIKNFIDEVLIKLDSLKFELQQYINQEK